MKLQYIVKKEDENKTVKQLLFSKFNISNRLFTKLKGLNCIFINSNITLPSTPVLYKDLIEVNLDYNEDNSNIVPTNLKLDIIYEDDCYIVINKTYGIAVHPSILHYDNSLSNGIKYYFDLIGLNKKIRPVNRIDKDTSGIVIFAKNEYIQESLIKQMNNKTFIKEYIAIVDGFFNNKKRHYRPTYC